MAHFIRYSFDQASIIILVAIALKEFRSSHKKIKLKTSNPTYVRWDI